jgi:hypothetical protein
MSYSALHESVHGKILCTSSPLCGRYSPLPKTVDPLNRTNEDAFDRDNLFLFQSTQHQLPRYRTASPFLRPTRSPASDCHSHLYSLRHIQLTQPRFYTSRLLAFHCFLCDHRSCVQRELVGLVVAVATRQAVPCWFVVWRSKARSSVLGWEQPLPFGAPARLAPRLHCH